ncbi:unnamed protein product [Pleuronectes platessa]|uniref:Uncharacterized protein n=1 Tax=Pleuronectes platessa TaxID=8262 RepID=A0A9N7YKZ5_PLEPL|nr:unnamed protein product [Pleuronectes platessa]
MLSAPWQVTNFKEMHQKVKWRGMRPISTPHIHAGLSRRSLSRVAGNRLFRCVNTESLLGHLRATGGTRRPPMMVNGGCARTHISQKRGMSQLKESQSSSSVCMTNKRRATILHHYARAIFFFYALSGDKSVQFRTHY